MLGDSIKPHALPWALPFTEPYGADRGVPEPVHPWHRETPCSWGQRRTLSRGGGAANLLERRPYTDSKQRSPPTEDGQEPQPHPDHRHKAETGCYRERVRL